MIRIFMGVIVGFGALLSAADGPITKPATVKPAVVKATAQAPVRSAASGVWVGVGPDMKVLPAGVYRFMFVPTDPSAVVQVTTVNTLGDVPTPTPTTIPVPVPVDDVRTALAGALAKVTDPAKAATASALMPIYAELVKGAGDGKITQPQLTQGVSALSLLVTTGKAGWDGFNTVLNAQLGKATTLTGAAAVLQIAVEELGKVK